MIGSPRSLRIGIDASRAATGQRTGVEGYSYHLVREMVRQHAPHQFLIYCSQLLPSGTVTESPAVTVRHIPMNRLWTQVRLAAAAIRDRPDVLFVPAHLLPLAYLGRSVVTVHDLGHLYFRFAYPRKRWWYLHLGTIYSARRAARVIADSTATARDLVERMGVPAEKIDVVPLGYDPRFRPVDADLVRSVRVRLGLDDRPYLLMVATIQPRKNHARLLAAFARLTEATRRHHRLVVAGKPGYGADEVYRTAQALGLGDAVRFLGYVPEDDLPALIGGATALVFPSLYEGFGLPAIEAMACGTPVIASNAGSLPEVVGDAGLLVDPLDVDALGDALAHVIADAALREHLRSAGLARSREYTWGRCAAETLRVLERAASSPS